MIPAAAPSLGSPAPHRPRPQAAAGSRHARRARDDREDRRRVAAAPGPDHALAAEATLHRPRLRLLGARAAQFEPTLRNTVNATIVRGGAKINVVPSEIGFELDGRALPGFTPEQVIADLRPGRRRYRGRAVRHDPGAAAPDLGLFETLAEVIRELDPEGIPIPLLQIGVTDGRFFSQAGVQTYGFLPMRLPEDFEFTKLITPQTSESPPTRMSSEPRLSGARCRGSTEAPDPRRDEVPRARTRRGGAGARARADPLQPRRDQPRAVSGG